MITLSFKTAHGPLKVHVFWQPIPCFHCLVTKFRFSTYGFNAMQLSYLIEVGTYLEKSSPNLIFLIKGVRDLTHLLAYGNYTA